jgi:superfamily II DNA or RNA helicase
MVQQLGRRLRQQVRRARANKKNSRAYRTSGVYERLDDAKCNPSRRTVGCEHVVDAG